MKTIAFEKVSFADAKRVHDGIPREATADDWTARRSATVNEPLAPAAAEWMATLPGEVCPRDLAERYPRIVNRIHALWSEPAPCARYLGDLFISRRGNRQGFPLAIAKEIGALTLYQAKLFPVGRAWT